MGFPAETPPLPSRLCRLSRSSGLARLCIPNFRRVIRFIRGSSLRLPHGVIRGHGGYADNRNRGVRRLLHLHRGPNSALLG